MAWRDVDAWVSASDYYSTLDHLSKKGHASADKLRNLSRLGVIGLVLSASEERMAALPTTSEVLRQLGHASLTDMKLIQGEVA